MSLRGGTTFKGACRRQAIAADWDCFVPLYETLRERNDRHLIFIFVHLLIMKAGFGNWEDQNFIIPHQINPVSEISELVF
jgi:hypothetical protein